MLDGELARRPGPTGDDGAGSSQPQGSGSSQTAVGVPVAAIAALTLAAPSPSSAGDGKLPPTQPDPAQLSASNKPPVLPVQPPASGSEAEKVSIESVRMHDILGSEALAAALREANDGAPGRGGASSTPRPLPGAHLAQLAAAQREPVVGMVMALASPAPAFLLAGQAADHWAAVSHQAGDGDGGPVAQAADDGGGGSMLNMSGDAEPPPAYDDSPLSDGEGASAAGADGSSGGFSDTAATARGGPVYLEQPDGSVQLALLVNPLYRPPADVEDGDHQIPLYQATVDETYQVRALVGRHGRPPGWP